MKKLFLVGALVILGYALPAPVAAQTYPPLGFCHLTSAQTGVAVGFASSADAACASGLPAYTKTIEICVEAQAVRYRDDGVAPTATVGMPAPAGSCWPYAGTNLSALQFISVVAGAVVDVSFYSGPK